MRKMDISETKTFHVPILIEPGKDSFYMVCCPTFKGCYSYGSFFDEPWNKIKEVIEI
jgi:predicted RNase H-like HicB family nuclease